MNDRSLWVAVSAAACMALVAGTLVITRYLPPWVPFSTMASGRR